MNAAALFGKLPYHGDFVVRGLSDSERRWWDDGLSASMAAARHAAADGFEPLYDRAPPWRFLLARPEGRIAGALVPSIDRAGRRFPVMAARRIVADAGAGAAAADCEAALRDGMMAGEDADAIHARLLGPIPTVGGAPGTTGWWLDGGDLIGVAPIAADALEPVILAMIAAAERVV